MCVKRWSRSRELIKVVLSIEIFSIKILVECGMTSYKHYKFVVQEYAYIALPKLCKDAVEFCSLIS